MKRIVLAYSGGLDTSIAIVWLAERFGAEIVTLTLDLGQDRELVDVRERALALGAVRAHVVDAREEFAREYVLPSLQAGAISEAGDPLATRLARPLIAKRLVEIARMEGVDRVATGCALESDDEVRLRLLAQAVDPSVEVIAPTALAGMAPNDRIEYAAAHGIPVLAAAFRPAAEQPARSGSGHDSPQNPGGMFKADANLWGRVVECRSAGDAWTEPTEELYSLTRGPQDSPDEPAYVEIEFNAGVPVRANGIEMPLLELIESFDTIAGAHGVGRVDTIATRLTGTRSRAIVEAPAATILHTAHRELRALIVPRDLDRLSTDLGRRYADLVDHGHWFSWTRQAIDAFAATIQPRVTGVVRLRLFKGDCRVVGRKSAYSLEEQTSIRGNLASRTAEEPTRG
jgi:argininosuccinate synthase